MVDVAYGFTESAYQGMENTSLEVCVERTTAAIVGSRMFSIQLTTAETIFGAQGM